jgi:hypothetical protein
MEKQPAAMVSSKHDRQTEREREREICSEEYPRNSAFRFITKADLELETRDVKCNFFRNPFIITTSDVYGS